ncbi:MAG: ABC-F family ATP-binding cassette domain-containing protein [Bdellovibrionota bacterium]
MSSLVSAHGISMSLPDGTPLFQDFNFHIGKEKVGLIGKNGIGKSTLLRLIAKEIEPNNGKITVSGKISYLPQKTNDFSNETVANILNVDKKLVALKNAEQGVATIDDLNLIHDDWSLKNEVEIVLKSLSLDYLNLDRRGESLSGGEMMRILFARLLLEKPDLILLDEPTNNLDLESKRQFFDSLESTKIGVVVVSHDRELLNRMDRIIEISNLGLKSYGGNFDFYLRERKIEDEATQNRIQSAEEKFKKQKKLERNVFEKQEKRNEHGKKVIAKLGVPRIALGMMSDNAEKTTARLKGIHEERSSQYLNEFETEKENMREQYNINIDIEKSKIPAFKEMIIAKNLNYQYDGMNKFLWKNNLNIEIIGNKRVCLSGKNGSGKSTLINLITGKLLPTSGEIKTGSEHIVVLDQKCSLLDENLTILENMKRFIPIGMKEHEIRIRAGRFLFYGEEVFKKVDCLSGGERLRVALACLLATNNAPDILILDEPTNNLDLDSIEILAKSLNKFEGTLVVISHDSHFLNDIRIDINISLKEV